MSNIAPFLMVATLVAAVGAATVSQAQPQTRTHDQAHMAQLRAAAGRASFVGPGVLVLAAR